MNIIPTTTGAAEVNAAFEAAGAAGPLAGRLRYTTDPVVSSDVIGDSASCVFDSELTQATGRLVEVLGWYDNEWGYTARLLHRPVRVTPTSTGQPGLSSLPSPSQWALDSEQGGAMFKVRIHGRGGQGAVTAAEMLSVAAFDEGMHAQAFPTFGSERSGAPVVSFCRIADKPIRIHEPISEPDALIIQDPTLLHQVKVFEGVGPEAYILINTSRSFEELGIDDFSGGFGPGRLLSVPATDFARERLGRPLPNAALLGGFAALTGVVSIDSVVGAIRQRFTGPVGEGNVLAAMDAFEYVVRERGRLTDA